jgi:AcrR family transcriptional regulator
MSASLVVVEPRLVKVKLFAQEGFENTSTAEICRLAGTSQSQLVSHFGSKNGILEAIFNDAWLQVTPAVRLAAGNIPSAKQKLTIISGMVLSFLTQDPDLLTIFLLEGRRMRGQGQGVYLAPAFLQFVGTLDEIIKDLEAEGELQPDVHPQALRSALMGAFEGLVRDRLLALSSGYPASYTEADLRALFKRILASCLKP